MSKTQDEKPDKGNLSPQVKDDLRQVVIKSVEGILPPHQAQQVADRLGANMAQIVSVTARVTKTHNGPMPPAEEAAGYEAILPGSVERMFQMAEKEQDAYIALMKDGMRRDDRFRVICMFAGLAALIVMLGCAVYLALNDHTTESVALFTMGLGSVIVHFLQAHYQDKAKE